MLEVLSQLTGKAQGEEQNRPSIMVGSSRYFGWTEVSITRRIDAIAGSFSFGVADKWSGSRNHWPIWQGDECRIMIGNDIVITGYVDQVNPSFSKSESKVEISGRDKTGDLVDCSVEGIPFEYTNTAFMQLVQSLLAPYDIPLIPKTIVTKVFEKGSIQPGETVFECLDRLCRQCGVILRSNGLGAVELTKLGTGKAATALVEGQNILAASASYDYTNRFSRYVVLGQKPPKNKLTGKVDLTKIKGEAEDPNLERERVKLIHAESLTDLSQAKTRAQWEAAVRQARSITATVTVQGWRQGNGALWEPNMMVPVKSEHLGLDGEMLIVGVRHSLGESTTTELELAPPRGFLPEPEVPKDPVKKKAVEQWEINVR